MASLLERMLPVELFERVLFYLLHHEGVECAASSEKPRGYAFQTAVLRTNRKINALAKPYFNLANRWTKIHVNVPELHISPDAIGIPVYEIQTIRRQKDFRDSIFPECTMEARVIFSLPNARRSEWRVGQYPFLEKMRTIPEDTQRTFLVLPTDLQDFVACLHATDLAYGARVRDWKVVKSRGDDVAVKEMDSACFSIRTRSAPHASSPPVFSALKDVFNRRYLQTDASVKIPPFVSPPTVLPFDHTSGLLVQGVGFSSWLSERVHDYATTNQHGLATSTALGSQMFIDKMEYRELSRRWVPLDMLHWYDAIAVSTATIYTMNSYLAGAQGFVDFQVDQDVDDFEVDETFWTFSDGPFLNRKVCNIDRFYLHPLDRTKMKDGSYSSVHEPYMLFFETIVLCDRIANGHGNTKFNTETLLEMRTRLPVGSAWNATALYDVLDPMNADLDVKQGVQDWLQTVKPCRWVFPEHDLPIASLKDILPLVEDGDETKYTLLEMPWDVADRPGNRYLL